MRTLVIGGPYFEDLSVGDRLTAPTLTLTEGHVALHQAILGDRLPVHLDKTLARAVFRGPPPLPPGLVVDVAIGQSSVFTRRVRANLFYRGLQLRRLPVLGDSLSTTTEVVALRQNRIRPDRSSTGLAVLRIRTTDQRNSLVLDFERCAMLPLFDQNRQTGHDQDVTAGRREISEAAAAQLASPWDLSVLRGAVPGPHADELNVGDRFEVREADVVSAATELARLTINLAETHYDARVGGMGRRLVYGGHTIGLATHQAAKAMPGICAVVAWERCDHTGPVYEDDLLTSSIQVDRLVPLLPTGAIATLRSIVRAERAEGCFDVLDWRYLVVLA